MGEANGRKGMGRGGEGAGVANSGRKEATEAAEAAGDGRNPIQHCPTTRPPAFMKANASERAKAVDEEAEEGGSSKRSRANST